MLLNIKCIKKEATIKIRNSLYSMNVEILISELVECNQFYTLERNLCHLICILEKRMTENQ
jgi:hypothetical protein